MYFKKVVCFVQYFFHTWLVCVCVNTHICIYMDTNIHMYIYRERILSFLLLYHCLYDFLPLLLLLSPAKSRPWGKISTGLPAILIFQIIQEEYHRVVSPILFPYCPSSFLAVSLPLFMINNFFALLTLILHLLREQAIRSMLNSLKSWIAWIATLLLLHAQNHRIIE